MVDHATTNRWVARYSPMIAVQAKKQKSKVASSWRMDETHIKVKGKRFYLYRAIDKHGDMIYTGKTGHSTKLGCLVKNSRADVAERTVPPFFVVINLDVFEHLLAHSSLPSVYGACRLNLPEYR